MNHYKQNILVLTVWLAGCLALPAGAAEWRYSVYTGTSASPEQWPAPNGSPTDSSTWVVITVPDSGAGSDTLSWSFPNLVSHPPYQVYSGRVSRACIATPHCADPWLEIMFNESSGLGNARDTQAVTIYGQPRNYVRTYISPESPNGSTEKTLLSGIGTVYYSDWHVSTPMSSYSNTLRLLEYNGMNIDSLWMNGTLSRPVAVSSSGRRAQPRFAPRRFDLDEMGIFLGRKSALKGPLPKAR